tara:strand:- start:1724 stop:2044 length:321 start_codon:yes stop_codon:yes gene_type:complete
MANTSTAFQIDEDVHLTSCEIRAVLTDKLDEIVDEGALLRKVWEPLLDSFAVVSTLLAIEPIVGFRLPPDKTIRKGGYQSVDEAIDDMMLRIDKLCQEEEKRKGSK